ncbi:acylase ACY 1 [Thecamonas trahens ATCC 50062]|uniref:Acylase ACY 1 n=1 Tax=Thecamonas trahens ATCC 50062 TaxID=461836 RepID=A0A0L0D3S7_THETB|nr:acylase ACY 1 [Thecamonas trahens ATCC 50062]KNC46890.1 acylase ACY 1 [Thecamonas trahens ATCC 50062]|eukprot:XP_013760163.1 acylase ACY 1 [Thecamonas trahens ATCC 50062]
MTVHESDGSLHSAMGVMGGFMQPQGHVQVLFNMALFGMDPQAALDAPRFCIDAVELVVPRAAGQAQQSKVFVEDGVAEGVVGALADEFGHKVVPTAGLARSVFGRGQIIVREKSGRMMYGGSDPRADGCAFGLY